jgi:hypothetical protein
MPRPHPLPPRHIDAGPESAERSLAALVLTVVELLRQLVERQDRLSSGNWPARFEALASQD